MISCSDLIPKGSCRFESGVGTMKSGDRYCAFLALALPLCSGEHLPAILRIEEESSHTKDSPARTMADLRASSASSITLNRLGSI